MSEVEDLRAEVEQMRADKVEFARWRDKWVADMQQLETKLAREEDRAAAAEAALADARRQVEAGLSLADKWERMGILRSMEATLTARRGRELRAALSSAASGRAGLAVPAQPEAGSDAPEGSGISDMARRFSLWLNGTYPPDLDPEAVHWRRVLKVAEEAGEVREAMGAWVQENPRKDAGSVEDVIKELADCVGAALGAIEHLTEHQGRSLQIATERVQFVCERVGVLAAPEATP